MSSSMGYFTMAPLRRPMNGRSQACVKPKPRDIAWRVLKSGRHIEMGSMGSNGTGKHDGSSKLKRAVAEHATWPHTRRL